MRTMRHRTYDSIQGLLADGQWHDAREIGRVTGFVDLWVSELRRDSATEVCDTDERVLLRSPLRVKATDRS